MNKLKQVKEDYNNILVPEDLDDLIQSSTKKARRQRRIHWISLTAVVAIMLFTIALHAFKMFG